MVTPAGFEPAISWMKTKYPKPLDDGATRYSIFKPAGDKRKALNLHKS